MRRNNLAEAVSDAIAAVGEKGGKTPRQAIESPDSLKSIATARIIDIVSEGEIKGFKHGNDPANFLQDIYYNETPIQNADGTKNFKNLQVEARLGTQTQEYIPGFPAVENELGIGLPLVAGTPWTRSFANQQLSAVRIRLAVSALSKTDTTTGDIKGHTIQYAIDVATDGGAFVEVMKSSFTGKASSPYERSHRVELPLSTVSGWIVRVRRITAAGGSAYIQDATSVVSVTEIIDGKFRYPLTALVGHQIDASQFPSIPTRAFHLLGMLIKVPTNYDPVTGVYATSGAGTTGGTWDGTFKVAYCNNPAWVFYDLTTNDRYGLGHLVQPLRIDKWTLYAISQYCDGMVNDGFGGTERRMTCNLYLQTQADAYKVLGDLSSIFRGICYWTGGTIVPVADRAVDPVYTYTNANVVNGEFRYESSSIKARHTAVIVYYNDMTDFGRLKSDYYDNPTAMDRYGFNLTEITAVGCTSRGQAQRLAMWLLYSEELLTNTVSFAVGQDGTFALPGQIVRVADKYRAGRRIGGRVTSATSTTVTLDAWSTTPPAVSDTITVILPSGVSQTRTINAVTPGLRRVQVSVAFSDVPLAESIWAVDSASLKTQLFRILGVSENEDSTYSLIALQHNPSIFDAVDLGTPIVSPPTTALSTNAQIQPTSVTITSVERAGAVIAIPLLTAKWPAAAGASKYRVQWQKDNGNWSAVQDVDGLTADYDTPFPGDYVCKVSAVNPLGVVSAPKLSAVFTLVDPTLKPATILALEQDVADAFDAIELAQDTADGAIVTFLQPSAPAHPPASLGDFWLDSDDGNKMYRSNGTTWVLANDTRIPQAIIDAAGALAVGNSKIKCFIAVAASPPTPTTVGDLWWVSDQNVMKRWNGSAWVVTTDNSSELLNDYMANAKFEQGMDYWTLQTGWRQAVNPGDAFQGVRALCADGTISPGTDSRAINDKKFSIAPGDVFIVSAMVKQLSPNGQLGLGMLTYDAPGTSVVAALGESTTAAGWGLTYNVYKKIAVRVVIPTGHTGVQAAIDFLRAGHTTGYWLIDNVTVTKMPSSLDDVMDSPTYGRVRGVTLSNGTVVGITDGNNLITNPSFKNRITAPPGVTTYTAAPQIIYDGWMFVGYGGRSYCIAEYGSGVSNILFRVDPYTTFPGLDPYTPTQVTSIAAFQVQNSRAYVLELYVSNSRNIVPPAGFDGLMRFLVDWCDGQGNSLGAPNYVDYSLLTAFGDTKNYHVGFNAPAGAKSAVVYMQMYTRNIGGGSITPAGSVWSDFRVAHIGLFLKQDMDSEVDHGTVYGKPANADLYDSGGVRRIGLRIGGSGQRVGNQRNLNQVVAQQVSTTGKLSATSAGAISVNAHTLNYGSFSVAYSAVSNAITGLTQNVTYVVYCYDDDFTGGTKTYYVAANPAAAAALGDGVIVVGQIKIPTSGSSTGGGGGGGSTPGDWCVAAGSYMVDGTFAHEQQPGMMLACYNGQPSAPNIRHWPIQKNDMATMDCVRLVTRSGATIVASKTTPMTLRNDVCIPITQMLGHDALVYRRDGSFTWDPVVEVQEAGEKLVCKIVVSQQCYFAGETQDAFIATHNPINYKP